MELCINSTLHYMRSIEDSDGPHYLVEGVTDVIDPNSPLLITVNGRNIVISPVFLRLQPDKNGNSTISIPIDENTDLFIHGMFHIDHQFLQILEGTNLHLLVKDRMGCYAVSGYEIIVKANKYTLKSQIDASKIHNRTV
jgi:hypothetical protein